MAGTVVGCLAEASTSVNAASERVAEDVRMIARWLLSYRVAMRKFDSALDEHAKRSHDLATERYTLIAAIGQIEAILCNLEDHCLADLSVASSAIDGAIDFAQRRSASDEHQLHDPAVRKQVFNLTGGKCAYCDTQLVESGGEQDQFCIEHVVPSSMGGPNHLVNYVPSCRSCNNSKGDRHVLYFIRNSFVLRDRKPAPVSPITPIAEAAE